MTRTSHAGPGAADGAGAWMVEEKAACGQMQQDQPLWEHDRRYIPFHHLRWDPFPVRRLVWASGVAPASAPVAGMAIGLMCTHIPAIMMVRCISLLPGRRMRKLAARSIATRATYEVYAQGA